MKYGLITVFCTLVTSASAATTLCLSDESSLFSCRAGTKVISVCGSKDLAPDRGHLQYRFGSPNNVELTIPPDHLVPPASSALAGTLMFSGGGGDYLRFKAEGYEYVVYTAIGKGWGEKDGVAIIKDGKRLAHISCTDEPVSKLGLDLSTKAGLKPDKGDFELP